MTDDITADNELGPDLRRITTFDGSYDSGPHMVERETPEVSRGEVWVHKASKERIVVTDETWREVIYSRRIDDRNSMDRQTFLVSFVRLVNFNLNDGTSVS